MKTPWELFQQRDRPWLTGVDAALIGALAQTRYESLLQQGPLTVLLVDAVDRESVGDHRAKFLAGFLAAASVPCRLVLGNPAWGNWEWQQVAAMFEVDVVWGAEGLSSDRAPFPTLATAHIQVLESQLALDEPPPSPQFWGDRVVSKSPRIGGFRGPVGSNEVGTVVSKSPRIGRFRGPVGSNEVGTVVSKSPRIGGFRGPEGGNEAGSDSCLHRTLGGTSIYIPTGGSSGQLRFAVHTWETLSAAVAGFQTYFEINQINACCLLPLHHVSGLMQFIRALITDGQLVIHPWKALEFGILPPALPDDCFLSLVPTQLQRLLRNSQSPWLQQFQAILLGGAPAWESLLTEARQLGLPLAPTYGMTETAGQVATLKPVDFLAGRSGAGLALPHATLTVGDDQGQPVPVGTVGQLMVQADSLMVGYFPAGPIGDDRSFRSDDLACFDADGYLHILGRASGKIITGGENVFPATVEAAILATDLVQDICVMSWPDADWGQIVVAAYVPTRPTTTPEQIQTALAGNLARYQWPRRWLALAALPRNAQGKIALPTLKTQLEKEFAPVSPSA